MFIAPVLIVALAVSSCAPSDGGADDTTAGNTDAAATTSGASQFVTTTTAAPVTETVVSTREVTAAAAQAQASSPFTLDERRVQQAPGTELVIQDVRVGRHDGYDRVVFEYSGTGSPGYLTGYNPEPLQQASGLPIEVPGNAYLEIMIHGTPWGLMPTNDDLVGPGPVPGVAVGNIAGVTHGGVFEADTQYFIGLDRQRPYHVFALQDPPRLVVDIER